MRFRAIIAELGLVGGAHPTAADRKLSFHWSFAALCSAGDCITARINCNDCHVRNRIHARSDRRPLRAAV